MQGTEPKREWAVVLTWPNDRTETYVVKADNKDHAAQVARSRCASHPDQATATVTEVFPDA